MRTIYIKDWLLFNKYIHVHHGLNDIPELFIKKVTLKLLDFQGILNIHKLLRASKCTVYITHGKGFFPATIKWCITNLENKEVFDTHTSVHSD